MAQQHALSAGNIISRLVTDGGFRNMLVVDLGELLAFLHQRASELSSESPHLAAATPDSLQQYSLASVQKVTLAVDKCKQVTSLLA